MPKCGQNMRTYKTTAVNDVLHEPGKHSSSSSAPFLFGARCGRAGNIIGRCAAADVVRSTAGRPA